MPPTGKPASTRRRGRRFRRVAVLAKPGTNEGQRIAVELGSWLRARDVAVRFDEPTGHPSGRHRPRDRRRRRRHAAVGHSVGGSLGDPGFPMKQPDTIVVDRHPRSVRLVRVARRGFFEVLERKLHWGDR